MELEICLVTSVLLVALVTNGVVCEDVLRGDEPLHATFVQRSDDIQKQLAEVTRSIKSLDEVIRREMVAKKPFSYDVIHAAGRRNLYNDLTRKRAVANHLLGMFHDASDILKTERKRTCEVNLGFHCDTEEIDKFAEIYDYLASSNSPGKKRSVGAIH